ncbi:MAG TPA: LLM class flavin-dependent oxidoreductase [Candidatus Bathyarchaeia archaeon]|nr:LLM class flavin-dependent oxidoreductase [Candidatus Bathyarchaeia archaeon]
MKIGVFYEHQLPKPWRDGDEQKLFNDALEQIELADRLGIEYAWEVEHHFLEEYSHSSAPEVFLAAASQRTKRIRLGHGVVLLPGGYNAPARVAERVATLDLVSNGRVELGTGESSSEMELKGFGVARETKRRQWEENLEVVTRMMVESPFTGYQGEFGSAPARNVVPKPVQKPHPPVWVACSRRDMIHTAAQKGIGALSFAFVDADEAVHWVTDYYATLEREGIAATYSVNANISVVSAFMCHRDEQTAIDRGLDGAHFFGYSLAHYYIFGQHRPGLTNIWNEFQERRGTMGFSPDIVKANGEPLGSKIMQDGLGAVRGAIGTPKQIRDYLKNFEECGVDQLILLFQGGRNRHEHICESLELFAKEVLPEFQDRDPRLGAEKRKRLEPVVEKVLARREAALRERGRPPLDPSYTVSAAPQAWGPQAAETLAVAQRVSGSGARS